MVSTGSSGGDGVFFMGLFGISFVVIVGGLRMVTRPTLSAEKSVEIKATWDPAALVWVASSDDVRGLATEAASFDEMARKLGSMVPELMALNNQNKPESAVKIRLTAEIEA